MNKLKSAIQELKDYLGSDRQGIALLDQITEIANAQRKRAASLEEAATASDANAKSLRSKLDAAELEIATLKGALCRESARLAASEERERVLVSHVKRLAEPDPEEATELNEMKDHRDRQVLTLLANVRRRFKKLPLIRYGKYGSLRVESFVKSFSYDEFAGLGMVMAACAIMNVPLRIIAERPIKGGERFNDGQMRKFVRWYRDAIVTSPVQSKIHDACIRSYEALAELTTPARRTS